jgi:nucleoside 2-deoxyribosyltransferase
MGQDEFFAFVLMPFDKQFDDAYRLGIKETARTLGILAERVDEQIYREGILERIYRQIDIADVIIADMTGKNPNVFYEVGYAHAKGKLCLLLTAEADDIPFDLKHRRHVVYGDSITTLRDRLKEELEWARNEVRNSRRSRITVRSHTVGGDLTKTKYIADGTVEFTVDLTNETQTASQEIDALYYYSTKRWTLYQDEKRCPSTASDVAPYDVRHFITLPVRRLGKDSWCQIKFSARTRLANALLGQEVKDSYRVAGISMLRIATPEGNFDHEVPVDATITWVPF